MKIAIFSDTFPPQTNGVANFVYQSARSLADLGNEVMIFTVSENKNKYLEKDFDNLKVVSLFSVPALIYPDERFTLPMGISLKKLKKFRPDIIHTHTPFAVGWEAVWGAKYFKIPLVGTHHTFYDYYLKHIRLDFAWTKKISWKYTVSYYNRCDFILSPSVSLAETLTAQRLKKPLEVLNNFIDTDLFRPLAGENGKEALKKYFNISGQSLVYMGRLSYEKSIDQVIRAFALMLKKNPALKLMLIGDGPEKSNLEKLAESLGIKNQVIFTGFLYKEDLAKALAANEIFLTASKSENMPLSVLEAMAAGLPIIAVKENGLAEMVKEGQNGFFALTDNPADLAEKTLALLADRELLKKFSRASRLLALEYSKEKISALLENFYKKVIEKNYENLPLS